MNKMGRIAKKNKLISLIFTVIFFLINLIVLIPKIIAPPPQPLPDQFIGEILPNQTLSSNLLNSSVLITIDSNNYPDKIDIIFDANYTFFNPENNSNIKLVLPFSLGIEDIKSNFEVKLNETQIEFDLYNFTEGTVNITEFDLNFISMFLIHNPITLIQCNLTILKNETYTIGYKFYGIMNNPLDYWDVLYIVYYLDTNKTWIGNTSGRVEFRVYGKLPVFSTMGSYEDEVHVLDINGGKSYIWNWHNLKMTTLAIGIRYDETSYPLYGIWGGLLIVYSIVGYTIITIIILLIVFIKKRKPKKIN